MDSVLTALVIVGGANLAATAWLGVAMWRSKQIGLALLTAAARRRR